VTTNVAGVREYVPGDSFNRIHWPSTARTGRLIVKEFELDPTADIWLFLDMQREVQVGSAWETVPAREGPALLWKEQPRLELDPTTEEYGVTIAASLARHFIRLDRAIGLIAYGQHRQMAQADRGDRQLTKLLETLAVIKARGRIPIGDVVAVETSHFSRDTTAVVVTPSTDEGLADMLELSGFPLSPATFYQAVSLPDILLSGNFKGCHSEREERRISFSQGQIAIWLRDSSLPLVAQNDMSGSESGSR